ncbi:sugar ABC transporter substrate-binding protein [Actinocorallia sp. A-T 12471]|uniref:sugar ABC transporter substrate-binding protein n=1 Tax=Actinocorallia sp. A-T 12471 TaxID=3089813 RepID=UPI0029D08C6D|nr:sugar ABC transporter substrate-binding protein [Actinocorallia sp. A-T 12471]MDX6740572.1 sugar ABC transporter substrate-binding protein [Actinocorallia sp. A-T 12471]
MFGINGRRGIPLRGVAALSLAASAVLAGCTVDGGDGPAKPAPSDGDLTIGFVNGNSIEFHTCLQRAMQARADGAGVKLLTANSAMDPAKELSNIDDMIVKGVDAIVVQTVNIDSLEGGINRANRAKIPIFLTSVASVDQSKILGAVVTDVVKVGRDLGAWLVEDSGGKAVKVGIVGGAPGAAADLMNDAFKESLGDAAEVVFDQPALWQRAKAQDVADNLLQAQPGVSYVFVHNEDMAFGVLAALKAAGRTDIKILTNGGSEAGVKAIRDGDFAVTVSNTPKSVGELAVDNVVGLLRGTPGVTKIDAVPETVVTSENASQAPPYCS